MGECESISTWDFHAARVCGEIGYLNVGTLGVLAVRKKDSRRALWSCVSSAGHDASDGWRGVEYCPVVIAKVECDKVVYLVVPGAAASGYHVWVLIGISEEEVLLTFPSMWCLSEVEHLIYFVLLQEGD